MKDYWACKQAFDAALSEGANVIVRYFSNKERTCEGRPIGWGAMVTVERTSDGRTWHVRAAFVIDVTRPRARHTPIQHTRALKIR